MDENLLEKFIKLITSYVKSKIDTCIRNTGNQTFKGNLTVSDTLNLKNDTFNLSETPQEYHNPLIMFKDSTGKVIGYIEASQYQKVFSDAPTQDISLVVGTVNHTILRVIHPKDNSNRGLICISSDRVLIDGASPIQLSGRTGNISCNSITINGAKITIV